MFTIEENKNSKPSFVSKAAALMAEEIALHYDLMAGTKRLREKGDVYMPPLPVETNDGYADKLRKASLYNYYAKTINTMVGLVLRREPQIQDNGAEAFTALFKDHWENITSDGTHGKNFLQKTLENQFAGHIFIVVDFPPKDPNVKDKVDEARAKRRPFWSLYTADQMVNYQVGTVDNKTLLTQITFKELATVPDGRYGEKEVIHYRTWYLKEFFLQGTRFYNAAWELKQEVKNDKGELSYNTIGEGVTKIKNKLPIAIAYGCQEGIARSRPPLVDLAYKNIEHFQDYADYRKGKTIAGIAFLYAKGLKDKIDAVGWDILFELEGEGEIGFVESTGAALNAQRTALQDVKDEMSELGMALLIDRSAANITATEAVIDHAQRSSGLLKIADSLKDAVEVAIELHGEYLGYPKEQVCSIDLGYKPEELVLSPQNVELLFRLFDNGLITGERLLLCFKGGGSLPDDMDIAAELIKARAEYVPKVTPKADEMVN